MRPMSWGPPAGQIDGRGGSTRPFATSHAAVPASVLRRHTMLPLGLRKRSVTDAAGGAASMRALASANDLGAPRSLPTARAVGTAVAVGALVGTSVCVGSGVSAGEALGASTVTVTVRRGAGR